MSVIVERLFNISRKAQLIVHAIVRVAVVGGDKNFFRHMPAEVLAVEFGFDAVCAAWCNGFFGNIGCSASAPGPDVRNIQGLRAGVFKTPGDFGNLSLLHAAKVLRYGVKPFDGGAAGRVGHGRLSFLFKAFIFCGVFVAALFF